MKVAVVGSSVAGSSAAILLNRAGHCVRVFEAVSKPARVGAGLLIQPVGMAVLKQLNVLEDVRQKGSRVERLVGVTSQKKTVLDLRYDRLHPSFCGIGIDRGVLFVDVMHEMLRKEGVSLETGVEVSDLAQLEGYDLVVIATGAKEALPKGVHLKRQYKPV